MPTDDMDNLPDTGREHIELLRETIDRNKGHDWDDYRERYRFTLVDDGAVLVSKRGKSAKPQAVTTTVDHLVTVDGDGAVDCTCYVAQRASGRHPCRHMRAVDSHPRL